MIRRWYPVVVIAVAIALSVIAYPRLPDRVPVHWGPSGRIDRWGSRWEGVVAMPLLMIAVWGLLRFLPRTDPRSESYAKMQSTYDVLVNAVLTLLAGIHGIILGVALGYDLPIERLIPGLIGILFVVLGNVLPRARPNWWFGIRTPWTLSNDRVWTRTHRVGGYAMAAAGVLGSVAAIALPAPLSLYTFIGAVIPAAVGPIVYSYFAWRKETRS